MSASTDAPISLPIFSDVPDGCTLHLLPDNAHWPVLRTGEWAVIDTTARDIEFGQLYLLDQGSGARIWQLMPTPEGARILSDEPGPWAGMYPLNRPRSLEELESILADPDDRTPLYTGDGPCNFQTLGEWMRGRVIGLYQAAAPAQQMRIAGRTGGAS